MAMTMTGVKNAMYVAPTADSQQLGENTTKFCACTICIKRIREHFLLCMWIFQCARLSGTVLTVDS